MTPFVRPDLAGPLRRWREVLGTLALALGGLWLFTLGGWFFQGLGLLVATVAVWGAVWAWRRMRFAREVDQPGIVEVDEGQVRYFGPHGGGFASLGEIVEVTLTADAGGRRWWRLAEAGGNVLSIPVAAAGAAALFDAFATLPGIDLGRLTDALDAADAAGAPVAATLWRRGAPAALPRPPGGRAV